MKNTSVPAVPRSRWLFAMMLFVSLGARAQETFRYTAEADRAFSQGLDSYRNGRYLAAAESFDKVARMTPLNQRTTASYIMKAKALLQLDEYLEASRTLRAFASSYPWSRYVADAEYMIGLTQARIRRYDDAMQYLLSAWNKSVVSDSVKLRQSIVAAIERIADDNLDIAGLRSLLARAGRPSERALLWLKIAEKHLAGGNVIAAAIAADSLDMYYPGHPYATRIVRIRSGVAQRNSVKLGALLPLMHAAEPSAVKQIGNDVYEGIVLAVEAYQRDPQKRVDVILETRDTERDTLMAVRGARELAEDMDVVGIIGPVFSQTTSAVVGIANARSVPLITPTANSNGIAASGPYVFQANPDYENRGRALARYAIEKGHFTSLGVLAPSDTYGKFMAEAFREEAIRLGARIVASEWYSGGATDLSSQLHNIRQSAERASTDPMVSFAGRLNQSDLAKFVQLGVPRKRLDSLAHRSAVVSTTFLLGSRGRDLVDSLQITAVAYPNNADSLDIPMTGIDAMYCPISTAEEIGVVGSQMVYFNIQTQLLGSGEWNNITELDANKRYCQNVVFESDNYVDETNLEYMRFQEDFRQRFKKEPGKSTLYGYDVARLVLELIKGGASNREALTRALSEVPAFNGLHGNCSFAGRRVNPWLKIIQYTADALKQVDEINVEAPPGN